MLRGVARLVPLGIAVGFLAVAAVVFLWQNHTTISREGDFVLSKGDDLVMGHHRDAESDNNRIETISGDGSSKSETRSVAKKIVLRKRTGLNLADRGHSAIYEAAFPEFPETTPFLRDVNRLVSTAHAATATEFAQADWSLVWDEFRDPSFSNREWSGGVETTVTHATDRAVCLLEMHSEYTGGAHGNYWQVARCFVEENDQARELKLADLFEPSSDWQQRLVTFVTNELRRQGASSLAPREDADVEEVSEFKPAILEVDDLATFALAPSGIWFFFAPYHVGCYAEGAYSVQMPYSKIENCIPRHSPARLFMPDRVR